jgi:hypothetical protein
MVGVPADCWLVCQRVVGKEESWRRAREPNPCLQHAVWGGISCGHVCMYDVWLAARLHGFGGVLVGPGGAAGS